MTERHEAILILRQARDILMSRLAERVIESKEAILDDARGELYVGGIDEVYEQIVTRLAHINSMLASLPLEDAAFDAHMASASGPGMSAATVLDTTDFALSARADFPALPAPANSSAATSAAPSFQAFGTQIHTGDMDSAGQSLAELFALDVPRGRRCAETFAANVAADPDVMFQAMSLRKQITAGNATAALMLLFNCFGLSGMEAINVLQTLSARLHERTNEE